MKKYLFLIMLLLLAVPAYAVTDTKISAYPADTSPTTDDLTITVDSPGSTPANKKVTIGNLFKAGNMTVDGTNVGIGSTLPRGRLDVGTGAIYGDGSNLTGIAVSTGWTDGGTSIYTTVTSDNVGIGTTTPIGTLSLGRSHIHYVGLTDDIATVVAAAASGDTLILASGTYTLTTYVTIDKPLYIKGYNTILSSSTASSFFFNVISDNVTFEDLTFINTGTGATTGIYFDGQNTTVFSNCVLKNIKMTLSGSGAKTGVALEDAGGRFYNIDISTTSTDSNNSLGISHNSKATAEAPNMLEIYGAKITSVGAGAIITTIFNNDSVSSTTITTKCYDCILSASETAAAVSAGVYSTHPDSVIYLERSTVSGGDYDLYILDSATIQVFDVVLKNATTLGTVTYSGVTNSGGVGVSVLGAANRISVKGAGTTTGVNLQTQNSSGTSLITGLDSGNVGLGTTTPGYKLYVNGTFLASDIYSGDGTQGATTSCSTAITAVTIKDGLVTAITCP